jgi:hypothetical protein
MKNSTDQGTQPRVKNTRACVKPGRVWDYLKDRFPRHTEKYAARTLSELAGEDISHRTVEGWRRRLPSSQHLLLIIQAWPTFVQFLLATEAEDNAAIASTKAEIADIEKRIQGTEALKANDFSTEE